MVYEILDANGDVENTIIADEEFVEEFYPGRYRLAEEQPLPEPEPAPASPTKEELLAQLQALQAQITALGE